MKYKVTLWFDESVDEFLDILERNNIDFSVEEVQDNKEEL